MYNKPGQGCSHSNSINHKSKSCHKFENKNWFSGATDAVKRFWRVLCNSNFFKLIPVMLTSLILVLISDIIVSYRSL